jgi:hypothetical protein
MLGAIATAPENPDSYFHRRAELIGQVQYTQQFVAAEKIELKAGEFSVTLRKGCGLRLLPIPAHASAPPRDESTARRHVSVTVEVSDTAHGQISADM